MISEIEKQFFETFEIKKKEYTQCLSTSCKHSNKDCKDCEFHNVWNIDYPQITDHILLELIRLGLNYDFVIRSKSKKMS